MGKETRRKTDTEESLLDSSLSNYDDNNAVSKFLIKWLYVTQNSFKYLLQCVVLTIDIWKKLGVNHKSA